MLQLRQQKTRRVAKTAPDPGRPADDRPGGFMLALRAAGVKQ